jgi:hypothetical protein
MISSNMTSSDCVTPDGELSSEGEDGEIMLSFPFRSRKERMLSTIPCSVLPDVSIASRKGNRSRICSVVVSDEVFSAWGVSARSFIDDRSS